MVAKDDEVLDFNDIRQVFLVFLLDECEDVQFHEGLILKLLLVANYLEATDLLLLVVEDLECLPEAPLTNGLEDLVAVSDVVIEGVEVLALAIIEPLVELGQRGVDLFASDADAIDLGWEEKKPFYSSGFLFSHSQ